MQDLGWVKQLDFHGQRAVITGGSSGMGAAAAATLAELGAEVHVLDIVAPQSETVTYHPVDMRQAESIEAAVRAYAGPVHILLNCAGMPQTFPGRDVVACNIAGLRHLTDLVVTQMEEGGSIVNISSAAAFRWESQKPLLEEFLASVDIGSALDWFDGHPDLGDPYVFSKMAVNLYTLTKAPQLARHGIRMNAVCPGNTLTAMTEKFVEVAGQDLLDTFGSVIGRAATPQDQADVVVFLASALARYVVGVLMYVDGGFLAAQTTRQLRRVASQ